MSEGGARPSDRASSEQPLQPQEMRQITVDQLVFLIALHGYTTVRGKNCAPRSKLEGDLGTDLLRSIDNASGPNTEGRLALRKIGGVNHLDHTLIAFSLAELETGAGCVGHDVAANRFGRVGLEHGSWNRMKWDSYVVGEQEEYRRLKRPLGSSPPQQHQTHRQVASKTAGIGPNGLGDQRAGHDPCSQS